MELMGNITIKITFNFATVHILRDETSSRFYDFILMIVLRFYALLLWDCVTDREKRALYLALYNFNACCNRKL